MPKLLDITVSEDGVVSVPSRERPQITPELLDIDVSEEGIVESASRQIVEQPPEVLLSLRSEALRDVNFFCLLMLTYGNTYVIFVTNYTGF